MFLYLAPILLYMLEIACALLYILGIEVISLILFLQIRHLLSNTFSHLHVSISNFRALVEV